MKLAPDCTACRLATTRKHIVWGEGPIPAPLMLVGEAPGKQEDITGRPFAMYGRSGEELTGIIHKLGLPRDTIYISNIVKCRPPNNADPKPADIEACAGQFLQREIDKVQPKVIGTVGGIATRYFLGKVSLERVHGIPFEREDGYTVVPLYHPAAGLRNPQTMLRCHQDFNALAEVLRGVRSSQHLTDSYPNPDYALRTDPMQVSAYLVGNQYVFVDTETVYNKPWSIQLSVSPGTAIVVMADDRRSLEAIQSYLCVSGVTTIVHNVLFDAEVMHQMGIHPSKFIDTMIMAYLLQSEPQGLKDLAYRVSGMEMSTYKDMVRQATLDKSMTYLEQVAKKFKGVKADPFIYWEQGTAKVKQPQPIAKKADKITLDTLTKDADPRDRWTKIPDTEKAKVEEDLGPMLEGTLADIPFDAALYYACRDADATARIYPYLSERIEAMELEDTLERDMNAVPMILDMARNGMKIVPEHFRGLSAYFQSKMYELEADIERISGKKLDVGSPKQVAELLFDDLKIKRVKGASTNDKILGRITNLHPVIQPIRDWRGYQKLKTTYSDRMPSFADENDRVHATIRITRVATGRLSTSSPNLLAQPVRNEESKKIRQGFVAEPGNILLSSDYSQLEIRCLAHESRDPSLLAAYWSDEDIHTLTASKMFSTPLDEVTKGQRYVAKRINFGIIYGIGAKGLYEQFLKEGITQFSLKDCEIFIEMWKSAYPGAQDYIDRTLSHCSRHLYVRTDMGRIRYLPNIRSGNFWTRAEAERMAINAPIQGLAADVVKEAMGDLNHIYRELKMRPLLQIHDDLLFEVPENLISVAASVLKLQMENAVQLAVPLKVDTKVGYVWGKMEDYESYQQNQK